MARSTSRGRSPRSTASGSRCAFASCPRRCRRCSRRIGSRLLKVWDRYGMHRAEVSPRRGRGRAATRGDRWARPRASSERRPGGSSRVAARLELALRRSGRRDRRRSPERTRVAATSSAGGLELSSATAAPTSTTASGRRWCLPHEVADRGRRGADVWRARGAHRERLRDRRSASSPPSSENVEPRRRAPGRVMLRSAAHRRLASRQRFAHVEYRALPSSILRDLRARDRGRPAPRAGGAAHRGRQGRSRAASGSRGRWRWG